MENSFRSFCRYCSHRNRLLGSRTLQECLARHRACGAGALRVCTWNHSNPLHHRHLDEPHGVERHAPDPYHYAAKISFCSRRTLSHRQATQNTAFSMRPARMDDIEQVADLHLEIAQTSVSAFPSLDGHQILTMTRDRAFDEAAYLIE